MEAVRYIRESLQAKRASEGEEAARLQSIVSFHDRMPLTVLGTRLGESLISVLRRKRIQ